ncbi:MAG: hypothetical protein FGF48_09035, partial [Candidatus Brockarchaeota archaeon]|nr:hypothetical protein [Candidatus Brockarchaeota archaeon]
YREKYLIDTERGPVLNLEQLDRDHMVLVATIRKFGAEFKEKSELGPDEYSRRTILLKPRVQSIVRTRVGDIAGADEIMLCEFQLELKNVLSMEEAEDILLNQYEVRKEVVKKLARRLSGVMLYTDEQGEGLYNPNEKGAWAEWKHFQIIQEYDEIVEYQKEIEGAVMDFVSKSNLLVDSKFRKRLVEMEIEDLLKQMAAYNKEWYGYKAKGIRAKVVFSFESRILDDDYKFLESKIEDRFGENWKEWLVICNGIDEFEAFIRKWIGK